MTRTATAPSTSRWRFSIRISRIKAGSPDRTGSVRALCLVAWMHHLAVSRSPLGGNDAPAVSARERPVPGRSVLSARHRRARSTHRRSRPRYAPSGRCHAWVSGFRRRGRHGGSGRNSLAASRWNRPDRSVRKKMAPFRRRDQQNLSCIGRIRREMDGERDCRARPSLRMRETVRKACGANRQGAVRHLPASGQWVTASLWRVRSGRMSSSGTLRLRRGSPGAWLRATSQVSRTRRLLPANCRWWVTTSC